MDQTEARTLFSLTKNDNVALYKLPFIPIGLDESPADFKRYWEEKVVRAGRKNK